jgi:hypothetical protein
MIGRLNHVAIAVRDLGGRFGARYRDTLGAQRHCAAGACPSTA